MVIEININDINKYSLEELSSSIFSHPNHKKKIGELSKWEILKIFRQRIYSDICFKILTLELEKYQLTAPTNDPYNDRQFIQELIRELLMFPSTKERIRVIKSDPLSHERIIKFMHNFDRITNSEVPKSLLNAFNKIEIGKIKWDFHDDAFIRECIGQNTVSHINGAIGILSKLKKAKNNNVTIIDSSEKSENEIKDLNLWIGKKYYSTFANMIDTIKQIKIIE